MQEFSSISVSSYEAGSLAERLTAQSRDGWDVVAIVPTGSTITAYLAREASADSTDSTDTADSTDAAVKESVAPIEPTASEPVSEPVASETAAEPIIDSAPAATAEPSWSVLADQAAAAERTPEPERSIPEIRLPESTPAAAVTPDPVSEPGGWAVAPESSGTGGTSAASADPTIGLGTSSGAASIAAAADAVAVTPAEPAAATTQPAATQPAQQAQAAAAAPAGWYADPSSRYELRYWDGTQWTEHVSRGGQQFTDPPVA
jgi:Protein of unknown function (DUF2510)